MRLIRSALCLLVLAAFSSGPIAAQDLSVSEWSTLPRILDTICIDLMDESSGCEQVILLTSETEADSADLVILPGTGARGNGVPLLVVRSAAYAGDFFGQQPSLSRAEDGSLILSEEQTALGRTPWMQDIRIIHSGGAFVVTDQSWSAYDRPAGGGFSCAVNFPDRTWAVSADRVNPETDATTYDVDETGTLAPSWPTLDGWRRDRALPGPCIRALDAWFEAAPL